MYACQIVKLMENDPVMKLQFAGVYARDTLPQCPADKKSVYIVNSDVSTSAGKHWLCIYCPYRGTHNEFFDSYGRHPNYYGKSLTNLLECNGKQFIYNNQMLQGQFSAVCGHYCVFYAYYRCRGKSMSNIVKETFTLDKKLNDLYVYNFMRAHFIS